jgi:predicted dehydrogenase
MALKPCLVEKPIIGSNDEIPRRHVLMVGYNLRFHSCVKKARAWLGEGLIGKPLWARFTCAQYNDKADYIRDGVTLNWSHEIDLAVHLLGHSVMMTAAGDDQRVVDIVLNHDVHHCQTVVHLDYMTKWERRDFVIVGTLGSIEVDLLRREAICLDNQGLYVFDNRGSYIDNFEGQDTFDSNYVAEARAFLDRLDGKDVDGCTADEAMQVVDICLRAKEAMK